MASQWFRTFPIKSLNPSQCLYNTYPSTRPRDRSLPLLSILATLCSMGALDYVSSFFGGHTKRSKRKQLQTVEIKVRMDCDGCERKVKKSVSSMKGVQSVDVNRKQQKLTVTGYVDVNKVVKKVKGTGKRAELWPYVPYNLVYHPYSAESYDKKAPSGYVRKVESAFQSPPNRTDERYTTLFSEDNANACTIM